VLFDEIDKAHPDVLTIMLQLFDEACFDAFCHCSQDLICVIKAIVAMVLSPEAKDNC